MMGHDPKGRDNTGSVPGMSGEATESLAVVSEWDSFFTERRPVARVFVDQLRRGVFRVPSEQELTATARLIVERKTGFALLLALLQNVGQEQDSLSDSVVRLAELALRQDGTLAPPQGGDRGPYVGLGKQLLMVTRKKRLTVRQRHICFTFIALGVRKGALEDGEVLELLRGVFPLARTREARRSGASAETASPMEILVRGLGSRADVRGLLDLAEVSRARISEVEERRTLAEEARARAEREKTSLAREVEMRERELERLDGVKAELELRIAQLDSLNADLRTEFRHRLDETRGRLRGLFGGELSRWLESAYEASTAEPPRTAVIRERLETAIAVIRREIEWLRTSE